MKISAVVNTRNEEKYIADCLDSLSWVDEIVVVDMESEDKTKSICYGFTKHVFNHPFLPYVEPARNFGIRSATGNWILIVDPDERIPRTLAAKLYEIAKEDRFNFVRLPRKNITFNHWLRHSRWWPDHNVRFFKKGYVTWQDQIHSIPLTEGEGLTLPPHEDLAIVHYNYTTIDEYLQKSLRYSRVQAEELLKAGYELHWSDLFKKPFSEFLSRFFAGEGYKDGLHGLTLALLQAFSEFLVYLRLWEAQGFPAHDGQPFLKDLLSLLKKQRREFLYWWTNIQLELTSSKTIKFFLRLRRRLLSL